MNKPKLIIATDGVHTEAVLDGVRIGQGISRLDFSTEDQNGNMAATIRILDLDVHAATLSTDTSEFTEWINGSGM